MSGTKISVKSGEVVVVVYEPVIGRNTTTVVGMFPEGEFFTVVVAEVPVNAVKALMEGGAESSAEFRRLVERLGGRVIREVVVA